MHYKTGVSRVQISLFNSLEDSIDESHYVRLIDALVEMLYKQLPEKFAYRGRTDRGCKSYHPCDMLKLYLYGYLNRISSSRRLETETYRNIEVKWLLHDLHPDHKTISDYRKNNTKAIRYVTLSFRRFLREENFIDGSKIIFDGSKVKACTSKEKIVTEAGLSKRIKKMEEQLDSWLNELNKNDRSEDVSQEIDTVSLPHADNHQTLLDEISALRQTIEELKADRNRIRQSDHSSYCPTDPDAHLMKSRDGFIPAYNVQAGTDAKHKMIVLAELTPDVNDIGCIKENVDNTKEQLDIVPQIVEADAGYGNIEQIKSIESNGITSCAIPLRAGASSSHDNKAGVAFTYNQATDSYTCSKGKLLKRRAKYAIQESGIYYVYQAKATDCKHCALFGKCTTFKRGRRLKVKIQEPFREGYVKRMETQEYQALIKERKDYIEHVFGTLKRWMGKVPLLLRGRRKVQAEIDLYASCYNLRRLMNIEDIPKLLERIAKYTKNPQNITLRFFLDSIVFPIAKFLRIITEKSYGIAPIPLLFIPLSYTHVDTQ